MTDIDTSSEFDLGFRLHLRRRVSKRCCYRPIRCARELTALPPVTDVEPDFDDVWSVIGGSDIEADDEHGLSVSLASLTMDQDANVTPRRSLPLRTRLRQVRSASLPSRFTACKLRRPVGRTAHLSISVDVLHNPPKNTGACRVCFELVL